MWVTPLYRPKQSCVVSNPLKIHVLFYLERNMLTTEGQADRNQHWCPSHPVLHTEARGSPGATPRHGHAAIASRTSAGTVS